MKKKGWLDRRVLRKTRGGKRLTREEVAAIKKGRRKLRRELWKKGIRSREEFEVMASGLGLYFDKSSRWAWLAWLFYGRGLWALTGALAALVLVLYAFSAVTELGGHFTIRMTDGLSREGFSLSEKADFSNPSVRLFAKPARDVSNISILDIGEDVLLTDGCYENEDYFAYTFYLRNEGESTVHYAYELLLTSESRHVSDALWVMLFEDDVMHIYAKPRADGSPEAIPPVGDDSRGYMQRPMVQYAADPEGLYQIVQEKDGNAYYRMVPEVFRSEKVVAEGYQYRAEPGEVHKYTVVIWLEGDDPDCTDALIGGHAGLEMDFRLVEVCAGDEEKK